MMALSFRTELTIKPSLRPLTLQSPIITAGSCFAEVMGQKMLTYKLPALVNPFGTIFNPVSLFNLFTAALQPNLPFTGELLQRDGLWLAYDLHSSFAALSREELLERIQQTLTQTYQFLLHTDTIILTFGTAIGYFTQNKDQLVANCHKVPQQQFYKRFLTIPEITRSLSHFYQKLKQVNPAIRLILTLSPVRHLKETLEGNSVSKSILRVACHALSEQYPDVEYFPAYELVLDDLRDYRFYKPDMIHPDEVAEAYIWEKFKAAYFNQYFQQFTTEWDKIQLALAHQPFHPESASHQNFLRKTLAKLENLQSTIDCQKEILLVKAQLLPG